LLEFIHENKIVCKYGTRNMILEIKVTQNYWPTLERGRKGAPQEIKDMTTRRNFANFIRAWSYSR